MIQPTNISTDFSTMSASIDYSTAKSVQTVDLMDTGSVAYDLDAAGNIVAIEILGFNHPERVALAREFAANHDLAFPRDLAGVLVPA